MNPFIVCCADCLGRGRVVLRGVNACIHVIHIYVTPRFACWQVNRQNSQKSECVLRRSPIGGTKTFCVSTRHPARTGFKASSTTVAETGQKTKCQAYIQLVHSTCFLVFSDSKSLSLNHFGDLRRAICSSSRIYSNEGLSMRAHTCTCKQHEETGAENLGLKKHKRFFTLVLHELFQGSGKEPTYSCAADMLAQQHQQHHAET